MTKSSHCRLIGCAGANQIACWLGGVEVDVPVGVGGVAAAAPGIVVGRRSLEMIRSPRMG